MDSSLIILSIIIAFLIVLAVVYISMRSTTSEKDNTIKRLEAHVHFLNQELIQERNLLAESKTNHNELSKDNSTLSANLYNLQERYQELLLDEKGKQEKFELLANRILEEKTKRFDEQHKEGIKEIFNPLKERINRFEEKVDLTNKETISRHSALNTQLNHLKELNNQITKETINLTKALKGDNKIQGNWGEIILESILQKSGLEKGREYIVQPTFRTETGRMIRPDIVINLPDNKKIIIDSKVSLKAYDSFLSSDDEDDQKFALKALSLSVKTHIDGLSSKNYHDIYHIESPDFVLMFIPIDTAFAAALSHNPELYNYAFDKNIVIVTSSTLLATLKTVDSMWKNEKQQKNALEIAEEAGKMYDKFSNLIEDFVKIGERLDMTKNIYEESMKKLSTGKGSLISKAEKMKSLGAKANKSIRQSLVNRTRE
ncbi:MAG: DNA recombination protein RmuC [Saprospiraceae bacterium]|jgi:DNA recombination protein RmuC